MDDLIRPSTNNVERTDNGFATVVRRSTKFGKCANLVLFFGKRCLHHRRWRAFFACAKYSGNPITVVAFGVSCLVSVVACHGCQQSQGGALKVAMA